MTKCDSKSNMEGIFIKKLLIKNFKCFEGEFKLELKDGLNILVGVNEVGKSTIIEAIHLALTGVLNGRYLKNELTQYLFNNKVVSKYIESLKSENPDPPPEVMIELYLNEDNREEIQFFRGNGNSCKEDECGISLKIIFDENYKCEYDELIENVRIDEKNQLANFTIPIEYYKIDWCSFARDSITSRTIPVKSALIDSSNGYFQNSSDIFISRIIKDLLDEADAIKISQAYRRMKEFFNDGITGINDKIKETSKIASREKKIKLTVDMSPKNAWENALITSVDDVPFPYIGRGEQCVIKTMLALEHKKSKEASIILLEEPENHLTHTRLNNLIDMITEENGDKKQVIVTTHSSFVANKLGLDDLILLGSDRKELRLRNLDRETQNYFKKLPGYDTLRFVLAERVILVEGPSDELVVQKAYRKQHNGKLPIEDCIDVISVGTAFKRFLEIAEKIKKCVAIVIDNDGNIEALKKKYEDYIDKPDKNYIKICYDQNVDSREEKNGKKFNYNTLEPILLRENDLQLFNKVFHESYDDKDKMLDYMHDNKTECALKIFETNENIKFPQYIQDAIEHVQKK